MTKNGIIRLLFSVLLIPVGALIVMLEPEKAANTLVSDLGLAIIIAGVVSTFHEAIIRRLEGAETAETVADEVHNRFREDPLPASGIRLVSSIRKGYAGYYLWAVDSSADELFFAGRSVLHRIESDFKTRKTGSVENVLARRVAEGCTVRIMFMDPRSNLIERLAHEEGQTPEQMLIDLATSVGIVVRLHNYLRTLDIAAPAKIQVRIYDELPYFAYHRVGERAIVGFYFSSALGHASAAYELVDRQTRSHFEGHFNSMFDRAQNGVLFELDRHRGQANFDAELLDSLVTTLTEKIGKEKVIELIPSLLDETGTA